MGQIECNVHHGHEAPKVSDEMFFFQLLFISEAVLHIKGFGQRFIDTCILRIRK